MSLVDGAVEQFHTINPMPSRRANGIEQGLVVSIMNRKLRQFQSETKADCVNGDCNFDMIVKFGGV